MRGFDYAQFHTGFGPSGTSFRHLGYIAASTLLGRETNIKAPSGDTIRGLRLHLAQSNGAIRPRNESMKSTVETCANLRHSVNSTKMEFR
jgi:hypothetical protein